MASIIKQASIGYVDICGYSTAIQIGNPGKEYVARHIDGVFILARSNSLTRNVFSATAFVSHQWRATLLGIDGEGLWDSKATLDIGGKAWRSCAVRQRGGANAISRY